MKKEQMVGVIFLSLFYISIIIALLLPGLYQSAVWNYYLEAPQGFAFAVFWLLILFLFLSAITLPVLGAYWYDLKYNKHKKR